MSGLFFNSYGIIFDFSIFEPQNKTVDFSFTLIWHDYELQLLELLVLLLQDPNA